MIPGRGFANVRPIGGNGSVGEHERPSLARKHLLLYAIQYDVRGLRRLSQLAGLLQKAPGDVEGFLKRADAYHARQRRRMMRVPRPHGTGSQTSGRPHANRHIGQVSLSVETPHPGSGWRLQSGRRQPFADLAGNVDLSRFLQKLRAAHTHGHFFRLLAQMDRLLRQAIFERL
ncbi:hypothetical protein [Bradyrhizobium sp. 930_D9_N1_4]|uniref:hypothetical protein n=1 Tax=Bradyrhizobium sp. 930_D9_N1_4 TaxID=3240374 RepID=UPI003F8A0F2B